MNAEFVVHRPLKLISFISSLSFIICHARSILARGALQCLDVARVSTIDARAIGEIIGQTGLIRRDLRDQKRREQTRRSFYG